MSIPIRELAYEPTRYSTWHTAPQIDDVADIMRHCQVISFDVFDTLLVRRVATPVDVFELVARQTGLTNFRKLRIEAEARARTRKHIAYGHTEVHLAEIYSELKASGVDSTLQLFEAELAAERLMIRRNNSILGYYDAAVSLNKTIVATSDVYLPASFLATTLAELGLPVAQVFASGEIGRSKHAGDLFDYIATTLDVGLTSILHIGDNLDSDFKSALKARCVAVHALSNNNRLFCDWRCNQAAIARLAKSSGNLFASFVLAQVANENASATAFSGQELFGRMYGGPMLFAFAHWIEQRRRIDGVSRIFLLARDGYAIAQALKLLGSNATLTIMHSSRRMCHIATLEEDFDQSCRDIASASVGATAREVIQGLELPNEATLLDALGRFIPLDQKITTEGDVARLSKGLCQCRTLLIQIAREERAALLDYLQPLRLAEADCAIVDCGWALTTHKRLEMLVGSQIRGYYVGTVDHAYYHEQIASFLFEKGATSPWKTLHEKAVELLELPFITTERRSIRMLSDGSTVTPLFSNREITADQTRSIYSVSIQREALKFCNELACFSHLFHISEMEETLEILFSSLITQPTSFELFSIQSTPHVRTMSVANIRTMGDYWRCDLTQQAMQSRGPWTRLVFYPRIVLDSFRRDGWTMTMCRIMRKLRAFPC